MSNGEIQGKLAVQNTVALAEAAQADRAKVEVLHKRLEKLERDVAMLTIRLSQIQQMFQNAVGALGKGPTAG